MTDMAAVRPLLPVELEKAVSRSRSGKIRIAAKNKSRLAVNLLIAVLLILTAAAFLTFDYQNIDFAEAVLETLHNIKQCSWSRSFPGIRWEAFSTSCW